MRISTHQVVECETAELCGLDSKIFESLGSGVDLLVDELTLDLVGRQNGPPKSPIQQTCYWLEKTFWKVDVSSMLDNLLIYQLGDLCC